MPFFMILLCTTAVIWLTQILQRLDLMVEDGGSLSAFLQVTILLLPSLVGIIAPFALVAAVLYAVNVLATDNELPVMAAAGASRLRIARPMIALSVLAGLIVLVINLDLHPRSYRQLKETVAAVRSDVARALIESDQFVSPGDGVTVYAYEARPGGQYIGLNITDTRDPTSPITYTAQRGLFRSTPVGPKLLMQAGTIQTIDRETGRVRILRFDETAIDLATFRSETAERKREAAERYLSELFNPDMSSPYDVERVGRFLSEAHARLALPLYPLAFGMIALTVLLTAPVSRRGYGKRVMLVILTAILMRTAGFVVQGAANDDPGLNRLQYALPLVPILVTSVILIGPFWQAKRRAPSTVFDELTPSEAH